MDFWKVHRGARPKSLILTIVNFKIADLKKYFKLDEKATKNCWSQLLEGSGKMLRTRSDKVHLTLYCRIDSGILSALRIKQRFYADLTLDLAVLAKFLTILEGIRYDMPNSVHFRCNLTVGQLNVDFYWETFFPLQSMLCHDLTLSSWFSSDKCVISCFWVAEIAKNLKNKKCMIIFPKSTTVLIVC